MKGLLARHPEVVLRAEAPLRAAMKAMTECEVGLVLVVDGARRLKGVVADIDLRRALLAGASLDAPVTKAMNPRPVTARADWPREQVSELFRKTGRSNIPLIDARGRLAELANIHDYAVLPRRYPNRVVVAAGGEGRRLRPLTAATPKPMIKIAGKPILEHLVEQLASSGFVHLYFTVNYLADKIRSHFGDGSRWGVDIRYLEERRPLGTVGALSLLPEKPADPILFLNGDVLTKANFSALLDFHTAEKAAATLCVKRHEIQIPYGVVELDGRRMGSFSEKPTQRFLVNAGIYVLEPSALALLPKGKPCDMPGLLERLRRRKRGSVACFPISEYWLDIGDPKELRRAVDEFGDVFGR